MSKNSRITEELTDTPLAPYETTKLYKESITLMETAYRIANKELEHKAKYIMGKDLCNYAFDVTKLLIRTYSAQESKERLIFINALKYKVSYLLALLRAIDNAHVRMTKASYSKMLGICASLYNSTKDALDGAVA